MEFITAHATVIHKVTLMLNENELKVLKALVQNPHCLPEDESDEMRDLRKNLWDLAEQLLNKSW